MYLIIGIVIVLIAGCIWGYLSEKKDYNKGNCPNCHGLLEHFGTDSQGGQGYVCENGDYTTWVSWPFIEVVR